MNLLRVLARWLASRRLERVAIVALIGIVLIWFVFYPVNGVLSGVVFSERQAADGPFQLLNSLRRIAAGMEFQYFHGKGAAWLHYPLYALFGQSLNSLELTRMFTSMILYVGGAAITARWALRGRRARLLFVVVMLAFALTDWCSTLITGGNSLVGVRAFMPLIVFAALQIPFTWRKAALVGVLLGASLAVSTEQGIAITASYVGLSGLFLLLKRASLKANLLFLLISLVSLVISLITLMILMSGGWEQALRTLRYNFTEVVADQVWYFGVPPNDFVVAPDRLANRGFLLVILLGYPLATWLALAALREKSRIYDGAFAFASLVFVGYGFAGVSSWLFSYTAPHLLQPPMRSIVIVVTLMALRRFEAALSNEPPRRDHARRMTNTAFLGVSAMLLLTMGASFPRLLSDLYENAVVIRLSDGELLSPYWRDYQAETTSAIEAVSTTTPPHLWGVYSGFLHDHYDIFNPVEEDYIIHALGDERRANYVAQFSATQPQFIEIPRADDFQYYQWMVNESWQFFELVYVNYRPLVETGHSWIMARRDESWQSPPSACDAYPVQGASFALPDRYLESAFPRMLTATIQYQTENPYGRIPLVGGLPRYFVFVEHGYYFGVSLPPRAESFTFPVLLTTPEPTRLDFTARSLTPNAALHVEQICLRETFIPPENVALMIGLVAGEVEED